MKTGSIKIFTFIITLLVSGGVFATQLSGTVSINPSGTASGTVFKNYNSLISYLAGSASRSDGGPSNAAPFGLSGNLTVNVVSATITERVTIPGSITGLGTYQLKFLGASKTGTILQYSTKAITDSQYVVRISGAKNVAFENMTIKSTAAVTTTMAAVGIHVLGTNAANSTNDILINNCEITMPAQTSTTYSSYVSGVVVNGSNSYTSFTTGGYSKKVRITNNTFNYGYFNLILRGSGTLLTSAQDAAVTGNIFNNSLYYSVYAYYATNLNFSSNTITQSSTTSSANSYGLFLNYCNGFNNSLADGNGGKTTIRNNQFSSIGAYGIYCVSSNGQSTGTPNEITGNVLLGNFRNSASYYYPMYFSSTSYTNIAHNTAAVNWSYATTSYGVLGITSSNYLKVFNNTFIGYGTSNAVFLTSSNNNCAIDYNNFYNYSDQSAAAPVLYYSGTATVYTKSNFLTSGAAAVNSVGAGMVFGTNNVFVNQGWASLTNLTSTNSCIKGAPLSTTGISIPSSDINGNLRSENEPSIGANEIGPSKANFLFSSVNATDQNNYSGTVFDSTSSLTISAYIHRGNITQATQYSATLFQNNVPLAQEVFTGNALLTCETDTLVFQYHPLLSSGSVTYKIVIDSINGKSLDSIPFTIQSNTITVAIFQKAVIDKSITLFSQLPIVLKGNAPDPGNWVIWRKLSLVLGSIGDSLQSNATFTGSRGSYHRVSYTISNNLVSRSDTFEFFIANCPTGFDTDSLILCDTMATLTPGLANSYVWNTGDSTPSLTVRQTGMYKVTLFSDSCVVSDSIYVQLNGKRPSYYVIDTLENCPGLGLNLWGTSYSPLITQLGNSGNQFKYLADTGHFQKVLINQWGCDSTISLNVLPLNYQELRLDTHACSIDPFFYFQGTIVSVGTDTAYLASASNCSQYYKIGFSWDAKNTDTVTQLATCQNSIQIKPKQFSIVDHIQVFVSSNGDSIYPQDSTSFFTFQAPGTYSIYSFYPYGNSSLSYSPPNIGFPPPPPPPPPTYYSGSACDGTYTIQLNQDTILKPTDTTICFGVPIQIVGNATKNWDSYAWSNGDTTSVTTINNQNSGLFLTLTVTNAGESCTDSIQINLHSKITQIPFDTTTQVTKPFSFDVNQYQSTPAQSYSWSNGDQASICRIYNSGWNSVTSVFANGCTETDSIFVVFNDGVSGTSRDGRFNYQAQIAFNNSIKTHRTISVRFSILHGQTTDFSEIQSLTTDSKGMIHTLIGNGIAQIGALNDISWEDGQIRMLQVEIDTTGQNQWISLGSSRLVSVPYAEYARTSGDGSRNVFAIFNSNGQSLGGSGAIIISKGNGVFEMGYEKSFQNEPAISIELIGSGTYGKRILFSDAQKCRFEIVGNPDKIHVTIHGK